MAVPMLYSLSFWSMFLFFPVFNSSMLFPLNFLELESTLFGDTPLMIILINLMRNLLIPIRNEDIEFGFILRKLESLINDLFWWIDSSLVPNSAVLDCFHQCVLFDYIRTLMIIESIKKISSYLCLHLFKHYIVLQCLLLS